MKSGLAVCGAADIHTFIYSPKQYHHYEKRPFNFADTQTRRHADTQTRRHADTQTRRHALKYRFALLLGLLLMLARPATLPAQTGSNFNWFFQNCIPNPPQGPGEGRPTLCEQYGGVPIDISIPEVHTPGAGSITFASEVDWGAVNGFVQNKNIEITNGDLIMDIPLIFLNCKFKMAGDVVIRTTDDNHFAAYFTKFFSCNNMWKGIEAKGDSEVALWWCELEDARVTLQIDDVVPAVYLAGNIFNRNHKNILNGSVQPGGDGTLNFPFFFDNTFECTSNTVHGNQFGVQNTAYHVHLDHCAASLIGIGHSSSNRFYDAPTAIYLEDADLLIQYAAFDRFSEGIYTEWGPAYSGSHVVVRNCKFDSEEGTFAVYAQRSDLEVSDSEINGVYSYFGLYSVENTASENIRIKDNVFTYPLPKEATAMVNVERPIASSGKHTEVNDNSFNLSGAVPSLNNLYSQSDGIWAFTYYAANISDVAEIKSNVFNFNPNNPGLTLGGPFFAINVAGISAADSYQIIGNDITVGEATMSYGIYFDDRLGARNEISHNTIFDDDLGDPNLDWRSTFGIHVLNANLGVAMCDNTVDGTQVGIQFEGNNGQSDFSSNNFGNHDTGLEIANYLGNPGSMGDQTRRGNTWLTTPGAYSDKAGFCEMNPAASEFIIENQFPSGSAFFPATNLLTPSSGWFSNFGTVSDWCAPMASPPGPPRLSDYDLEVAGGTGTFSTLSTASKWEARRMLTDKLVRYPSLMSGNATVTGFFNTWLYNSPGQFAQVSYQIGEAYAIEPADQSNMDALESQRGNIQAQLIALESGQAVPQEPTTNPELAAAKEALLAQLRPLHTQEAALKAQIRQKQVTKLQAALTANDQLPAATAYETNRRLFNRLGIQLFLNGTLNAAEEAQLMALTAEGQADGGLAVEDAKHLLPKCQGSAERPSRGQERGGKLEGKGQTPSLVEIEIIPNPANGATLVNIPSIERGTLTLRDASGKTWHSQPKEAGASQIEMNVAHLPMGIYFLSFVADSGFATSGKLIVQH